MSKKKETFMIGSEWVYYKIYGNPEFINLLLVKYILPLTNKLAKTEYRICSFYPI